LESEAGVLSAIPRNSVPLKNAVYENNTELIENGIKQLHSKIEAVNFVSFASNGRQQTLEVILRNGNFVAGLWVQISREGVCDHGRRRKQ
jgi:hypothetical protein